MTKVGERDKISFLEPVGGPITIGGADEFRAADWFREGAMGDGVRILMNGLFREHFLGKTEKNVPKVQVAAHELTAYSYDPTIITALGGEERAELQLAHISELMLITQEWAVSLLVKIGGYARCDCCDRLWAVHANWDAGNREWDVVASSVENSHLWHRARRVFSRDS